MSQSERLEQAIQEILSELDDYSDKLADLVRLAMAYGNSFKDVNIGTVLAGQLEEILQTAAAEVAEDACCGDCGACDSDHVEYDLGDLFGDMDDCDCGDCDICGYAECDCGDCEECCPEPEVDKLSEELGVDVNQAPEITLAAAILARFEDDEASQIRMVRELGERGKNMGLLSTHIEQL